MSSNSLLNSPLVKELVTCKICSKFFEDPKILPCQHSFCCDCIQNYFDKKELEARRKLVSIRCPECFNPTALPLGGISFFPADHKAEKIKSLLQDMMMHNILRSKTGDNDMGRPRSGSNARARPYSYNLEDVDLNVLASELRSDGLVGNHTGNVTNTDTTGSLTKAPIETKEVSTCTHEDVFISKLVACDMQDCAIQTDVDATFNLAAKSGKAKRGPPTQFEKDDSQDEGYDTLGTSARKRSATVDVNVNSSAPTDRPTQNCLSHSKRSCQALDGVCKESPAVVNCAEQTKHSTASTHSAVLSEERNTTEQAQDNELNSNYNAGIDDELLKEQSETVKMNGTTNGDVFDHTFNGEDETFVTVDKVYEKAPLLLWSVEKHDHDMPTDIVVTPNGGVTITDYGNCKIQHFESNGEYVHSIDNIKPFSIAFDKNTDNFVVADRKDKSIKVFDQGGGMLYDWEKNSFHWICGLAVTNNGNFVVFDRELTKIGVYNQEGTRLTEFGSYGDGDSHLCMTDFLAVDSHDRIIVCDSGHHCIKVFDTQGGFLGRFSCRGSGPDQLLWPKSVTVDASDNILVTDQRNNRISLFSPDGRFIQHILPNYNNPYNLSLNQSGVLGVTSYDLGGSSCISVYKL